MNEDIHSVLTELRRPRRLAEWFAWLSVLALAVLAACFALLLFAPGYRQKVPPVNGKALTTAMGDYAYDLKRRGEPFPASVSLDRLVDLGYLKPDDVRAFEGVTVVFHSDADDTHPQMILAEALLPDGIVVALLADGSVQQLTPQRYKDQIRAAEQDGPVNGSLLIRAETNRTSSASARDGARQDESAAGSLR